MSVSGEGWGASVCFRGRAGGEGLFQGKGGAWGKVHLKINLCKLVRKKGGEGGRGGRVSMVGYQAVVAAVTTGHAGLLECLRNNGSDFKNENSCEHFLCV